MKFRFVGILIVIEAIIGLCHYLIYKTILSFAVIVSPTALLSLRLGFGVLALSFVLMSLLAIKFYGPLIRIFYTAAAVWLGTLFWLLLATLASWLLFYIANLFQSNYNILILILALFGLALGVSIYGLWNSNQNYVRQVTVTLNTLPPQWRGRKAVLVTDTHLGNIRNVGFAKKIAALISAQQADIVFFAGDLYDGTIEDYAKLVAPLQHIDSRYGVYFSAGNHEEFHNSTNLLAPLRQIGFHVLDNEVVTVDGLQIAGIYYSDAVRPEKEAAILHELNLRHDQPSILIKHVPDQLDIAQAAGIDLQVSGHTHVGQMWPFSLIARHVYGKFVYGLNRLDTMQVYTSSGAGTWGPPQRIGTRAEITVLTFA